MFVQIETFFVFNTADANLTLRAWQQTNPKRHIINVNTSPAPQEGWFMTIVYEVEVPK